jgi:hypothetical protein
MSKCVTNVRIAFLRLVLVLKNEKATTPSYYSTLLCHINTDFIKGHPIVNKFIKQTSTGHIQPFGAERVKKRFNSEYTLLTQILTYSITNTISGITIEVGNVGPSRFINTGNSGRVMIIIVNSMKSATFW